MGLNLILKSLTMFAVVLYVCGFLQAISAPSGTAPPIVTAANREDSDLLSSVVASNLSGVDRKMVVISETIASDPLSFVDAFTVYKRTHPQPSIQEAFDDFKRRNASLSATPPLVLEKPTIYVKRSVIHSIFEHGFWNEFYNQYPGTGGFIDMSLPGYSKDRNTALLYLEMLSGGLNGSGELLLLEKKAGFWKVKDGLTGWVS